MGWKEDVVGRLWEARADWLMQGEAAAEGCAQPDYVGLKDGSEPVFPLEEQLEWRLPGPPDGHEAGPEAWLEAHREEAEQLQAEFWRLCGEVGDNAGFYVQFAGCDLDVGYAGDGMSIKAVRRPMEAG